MKNVFLVLFALLMFVFPSQGRAAPSFELMGYYNADTFSAAEATTEGQMYFAFDILTNLNNKKSLYAGFHVQQLSITEAADVTTTFTSLDMGPFLTYMLDRKNTFSITLGYNVKASGTYNNGTEDAAWNGTSLLASLGVMPEVGEDFYLGFKINYYSVTYTKEIIASDAADVTYTRALIFPTFGLTWRF